MNSNTTVYDLNRGGGLSSSFRLKGYYLLYAAFFALGMNQFIFYVPLFALYFLLKGPKIFSIGLSKSYIILAGLMLLAIFPLYTIGYDRILIDSPLYAMLPVLFAILVAGFAFQYQTKLVQYRLISMFVIGFGLQALIITGYSFFTDPIKYGYGEVLNPFNGKESNSPGVGNNLSILATLLIYFLFDNLAIFKKVIIFLVIGVVLMAGLFLGGRTFFIITAASLLFMSIYSSSFKNFLFIGIVLSILSMSLLDSNEYLVQSLNFTVERFSNRGLDSVRFELYTDGLGKIAQYPFGGFTTDAHSIWFHNVFLDNARLAGWLPVISLFLAMVYILSSIFYTKHMYWGFGFLLFSVSVLIMQQDVVIEGNYGLLILMYFSGLLMLKK